MQNDARKQHLAREALGGAAGEIPNLKNTFWAIGLVALILAGGNVLLGIRWEDRKVVEESPIDQQGTSFQHDFFSLMNQAAYDFSPGRQIALVAVSPSPEGNLRHTQSEKRATQLLQVTQEVDQPPGAAWLREAHPIAAQQGEDTPAPAAF